MQTLILFHKCWLIQSNLNVRFMNPDHTNPKRDNGKMIRNIKHKKEDSLRNFSVKT